MVGVPQTSVAVAPSSAVAIAVAVGLQPRFTVVYVPVNTGGVTSTVHVNTCVHVAVFPQPSVAVYVLV